MECAGHQFQPTIAGPLSNGEGRMPHAQPGMTALFDVGLRTAEAENQEIAQALFRAFQIVWRIHRAKNVIAGNLAVKRIGKPFESGLSDGCVNVLLFH